MMRGRKMSPCFLLLPQGFESFLWDLPRSRWRNLVCVCSVCRRLSYGGWLVMGVGFKNICTVWREWNVSRVIPRLYGWVYKTWRLFPLADEHSVEVMTAVPNQDDPRLYPMSRQVSISVLLNLCSKSVGA